MFISKVKHYGKYTQGPDAMQAEGFLLGSNDFII